MAGASRRGVEPSGLSATALIFFFFIGPCFFGRGNGRGNEAVQGGRFQFQPAAAASVFGRRRVFEAARSCRGGQFRSASNAAGAVGQFSRGGRSSAPINS